MQPTSSGALASLSTLRVNYLKRLSAVREVRAGLPQLHDAQRQIFDSGARFKVARCGRRFGKTEVAKVEVIERLLDEQWIWWLAPTYGQAQAAWRDLMRYTRPLGDYRKINMAEKIIYVGDGFVQIRTGNKPDNLRGAGLDYAVLDEAAFQPAELWPEVIRPMLMNRQGSAIFPSTPDGMNHFWGLHKQAIDPDMPKGMWANFHFTSYDNPLLPRSEIDAMAHDMTARTYQQEIMAEFVQDGGAVFNDVRGAVAVELGAQPVAERTYITGVDWGRDNDYTAAVVIERETLRVVDVKRWRGKRWRTLQGLVVDIATYWNDSTVWAESNSMGATNIEAMQDMGADVRPFNTTAKSKSDIIDGLALAIERKAVKLLNDDVLLDELIAYGMVRLPGGLYRYSAPAGGHDDTVIALALALAGATVGTTWNMSARTFTVDFA